ncbi:BB0158 famile outer surface lipoprotein [Borreliella americana]
MPSKANTLNSYNFGIFDNSLTDSFKLFYKNSKCNYYIISHLKTTYKYLSFFYQNI